MLAAYLESMDGWFDNLLQANTKWNRKAYDPTY